jgi:hypothetical protein
MIVQCEFSEVSGSARALLEFQRLRFPHGITSPHFSPQFHQQKSWSVKREWIGNERIGNPILCFLIQMNQTQIILISGHFADFAVMF